MSTNQMSNKFASCFQRSKAYTHVMPFMCSIFVGFVYYVTAGQRRFLQQQGWQLQRHRLALTHQWLPHLRCHLLRLHHLRRLQRLSRTSKVNTVSYAAVTFTEFGCCDRPSTSRRLRSLPLLRRARFRAPGTPDCLGECPR